MTDFSTIFKNLCDSDPFPWQAELYKKFIQGDFPSSATIPTGLGKTSIVAVWLIALASAPSKIPRRLVYVVNRRTVVDQTTAEVERLCNALLKKPELKAIKDSLASLCALPLPSSDSPPLAASTLRGQFADNGEWCTDPARPAVVVGTVDMIGSGLLFSRYTRGFKTRPLHAGFLGQDALIVHDEAHLEPVFQKLLKSIDAIQKASGDVRSLQILELTATSRTGNSGSKPFGLDENEENKDTDNETIKKRVESFKKLNLLSVTKIEDGKDNAREGTVRDKIIELANGKKDSTRAVLIFVRSVESALAIKGILDKIKCSVVTLTGTMRGKERDELASSNPIFQRFLAEKDRNPSITPTQGTVFLVATSAGEVGVNISADDLICDLSTYDSMAQRFGRVNRFGDRSDTEITVVYRKNLQTSYDEGLKNAQGAKKDADKKVAAYQRKKQADLCVIKTLELLKKLNDSASPAALAKLSPEECADAFSPAPKMRLASDIQFDAWALTSIREPIAARPPVAPYLHGEDEQQPSETLLAWRRDLDWLDTDELRSAYSPSELLEDFPLKPRELLHDTRERIYDQLVKLLEKHLSCGKPIPDAWLISENGSWELFPLIRLITDQTSDEDQEDSNEEEAEEEDATDSKKAEKKAEKTRKNRAVSLLANATLILPDSLGGIKDGLLTPDADAVNMDAADIPNERCRVRSSTPTVPEDRAGKFRLLRAIDTQLGEERADDSEETTNRYCLWLEAVASKPEGNAHRSNNSETLDGHTSAVTANATAIAKKLLPANSAGELNLRHCLILAARWHDLGKNRAAWQRNIGNVNYDPTKPETILAKSAHGMRSRNVAEHYRHEFGSLNDVTKSQEFASLSELEQDIVLHLVAAHHGRARPHFPSEEIFDYATQNPEQPTAIATEVPRRFARLQQRFGRWGLAWLESLLRAADYAASAGIVAPTSSEPEIEMLASTPPTSPMPGKETAQVLPTATLAVNPANPGHYFACCGLFELASRLSPSALAWFEQDASTRQWQFHLANTLEIEELMTRLNTTKIKVINNTDNHSAFEIESFGNLCLNWWRHENRASGKLKTWAGQMKANAIFSNLQDVIKNVQKEHIGQHLFSVEATPTIAVSYFDAPRSANATALDVGFSMDKLEKGGVCFQNILHPFVEFFCFVGLQRTRPVLLKRELGSDQEYSYNTWSKPIHSTILPAATGGFLPDCHSHQYHFTNPSRTKDYLAFNSAKIVHI